MKGKINISSEYKMIDDKLQISINGLQPFQEIKLEAEAKDDMGRNWMAFGFFVADEEGNVDLSKDRPINGSYTDCDASELLWSMTLQEKAPSYPPMFLKMSTSSHEVTFRLLYEGIIQDKKVIDMNFTDTDTEMITLDKNFIGKLFKPKEKNNLPALIVLGGSSGGFMWSEQIAALLSSRGYAALALSYFDYQGNHGLPNELIEVPLEYIDNALEYLSNHQDINSNKIGMIGISKGAELSLILSSLTSQQLAAVIGYVPSSHVFQGISMGNNKAKSSWTYKEEPLSYIDYPKDVVFTMNMDASTLCNIHERALQEADRQQMKAAEIKVENINCPLLLISGEKDATWPSYKMCKAITKSLKDNKHSNKVEHINFPAMGHAFFIPNLPPIIDSPLVTAQDAAKANREAWNSVLQFLDQYMNE